MFTPNEIPLVWGDAGWQLNPITYPEGVPIFVYLETHHSRYEELDPRQTAFQMVADAYASLKACDSEFDASRNYVAGASPGECLGAYIDDYYDHPECWGASHVEAKMLEIMSVFVASTPEWINMGPLSKCRGAHFRTDFLKRRFGKCSTKWAPFSRKAKSDERLNPTSFAPGSFHGR